MGSSFLFLGKTNVVQCPRNMIIESINLLGQKYHFRGKNKKQNENKSSIYQSILVFSS